MYSVTEWYGVVHIVPSKYCSRGGGRDCRSAGKGWQVPNSERALNTEHYGVLVEWCTYYAVANHRAKASTRVQLTIHSLCPRSSFKGANQPKQSQLGQLFLGLGKVGKKNVKGETRSQCYRARGQQ